MGRLEGKIALITGAALGLGRAASQLFAREGAKIVALDLNEQAGLETAELIKQSGGKIAFIKCDVSDEAQVKNAVEIGVDTYGKLNILLNNAGVLWSDKDGSVTEMLEEDWNRIMDINVKGPFWICRYGIPELIKAGGGSIINISSPSAHLATLDPVDAYVTSKGALISLTKSLAVAQAKNSIRVNTILPGAMDTPMQSHLDDEGRKMLSNISPMGRMAKPEEIAYAALFLASDEASFVTGAEFVADGGVMAYLGV
ncbi:MAG: glucose 1-dehydrogenase [Deltaproteobacteria bacterium]|nr:glucose 1-dehydrogenase [Deltaproteobacteria bacterium]